MRDTEGVEKRARQRRRFTREYPREVVQETLAPGASVAGVALRHRLNANLVFTWRRKLSYFKHCAEHSFHLQQCDGCQLKRYPPTTACLWCMSGEAKWVPVEGKGAVHSRGLRSP